MTTSMETRRGFCKCPNCPNSAQKTELILFPPSRKRQLLWTDALGLPEWDNISPCALQSYRLCGIHFDEKYKIRKKGKLSVTSNAVPHARRNIETTHSVTDPYSLLSRAKVVVSYRSMECLLCGSLEIEKPIPNGAVHTDAIYCTSNQSDEAENLCSTQFFSKIFKNIPLIDYCEQILQNSTVSYCLGCKQLLRRVDSLITKLEIFQNRIRECKKSIQVKLLQTYRKSNLSLNQSELNSNSQPTDVDIKVSSINCLRAKILQELQPNTEIETQTEVVELSPPILVSVSNQSSELDTTHQNVTERSPMFGNSTPPDVEVLNIPVHVKLEVEDEDVDVHFEKEVQNNPIQAPHLSEQRTITFLNNFHQTDICSTNSSEQISNDYSVLPTNATRYRVQMPTWNFDPINSYSKSASQNVRQRRKNKESNILGLPENSNNSVVQNEVEIQNPSSEINDSLTCVHCHERFADLDKYVHHTNTSHFKRPNLDPNYSNAAILEPGDLKDEARKYEPYQCHICSRKFSSQASLKTHVMFHLRIKPFKCEEDECTAAFTTKGELVKHSKAHRHPHKCEFCKLTFLTVNSLHIHLRLTHNTNTNVMPIPINFKYNCEHCQQYFYNEQDLHQHLNSIHPIMPQLSLCSQCNFQCESSTELVEHLSSHAILQLPFICGHCEQQFTDLTELEKHAESHKNRNFTSGNGEKTEMFKIEPC